MLLSDICDLQTGYTARGRLEPAQSGGQIAIQLRDLTEDGVLNSESLQRYRLGELSERYFVGVGDVIFRSRGETNKACAINDALPAPAVVILPLMILRPKKDMILPGYLAWAINQPDAQRQLDAQAQGTSLRMISKPALEGIELPVPGLETQQRIVAVGALAEREFALLRQLAGKRHHLTSLILTEQAKAARHGTLQKERTQ